jgi:hypothetical protein
MVSKYVKEFLRPSSIKFFIFMILAILGFALYSLGMFNYPFIILFAFFVIFFPIYPLDILISSINLKGDFHLLWFSINLLLVIIYWYVLACLIVFVLNKLKIKKKQSARSMEN